MDRKLFNISKIDKILWMGYIALIIEIVISSYIGIVPYLLLSDLDLCDTLLVLMIFIPLLIVILWSFIYLLNTMILRPKSISPNKKNVALFYLLTAFIFLFLTFMFQPRYILKSDIRLSMEIQNIMKMQKSTKQMIQENRPKPLIYIKQYTSTQKNGDQLLPRRTYDFTLYDEKTLFVADSRQGLELWSRENKGQDIKLIKKLDKSYVIIYRIRWINGYLLAIAQDRDNKFYLVSYTYDPITQTIKEVSKLLLRSLYKNWLISQDNQHLLLSSRDISEIDISTFTPKPLLGGYIKFRSQVNDIDFNQKYYYILTSRDGLYIYYRKNNNHLLKFIKHYPNIMGNRVIIDDKSKMLYVIKISSKSPGTTITKYQIKHGSLEKIFTKPLPINFRSFGVIKLIGKYYNDRLYISNANSIFIYDKDMNQLALIAGKDIRNFKFNDNELIYISNNQIKTISLSSIFKRD